MRIETFDHMPQVYRQFYRSLSSSLSDSRLITDPLRTLAYGTDASFYRLIPKLVIKTDNEQEVALITVSHWKEPRKEIRPCRVP